MTQENLDFSVRIAGGRFAALSGSVAAVGIALWLLWLIAAGGILASAAGLVFEYYVGPGSTDPAPEGQPIRGIS